MKKLEISRRNFLGRSGSLALAFPLAALPAAKVKTASGDDIRQPIPNRTLPTRSIGTGKVTASLPTDGTTDCSAALQSAIDSLAESGGGIVTIPWAQTPGGTNRCIYMIDPQANISGSAYYGIMLKSNVRLQFKPGVRLQAMTINRDPSKLTDRAYMMYGVGIHDVEIANGWLVGERYTHIYSGIGTGTDE